MSRQIDQEIIQATDELKKDVALTTEIITGNENTVVEVAPGNTVRSPKKMIEDCYQETQLAIEEKFESLDQAVNNATAAADRADSASQSALESAGDSATSATTASQKAQEAEASATEATSSEQAAADSAAQALTSANNAKASEAAAGQSANDASDSATAAAASASTATTESEQASQSAVTATEQATRAQAWAANPVDDLVEGELYSSLHYAQQSSDYADAASANAYEARKSSIAAETSMQAASSSELNAGLAETQSQQYAANALQSKNASATSEQNAADSKNAAQASETAASNSASAAKVSETAAASSASTATQQANRSESEADRSEEAAASLKAISNPNLLINGDFSVWQRGTVFTPDNNYHYCADRWLFSSCHGLTIEQESLAASSDRTEGLKNYLNFSGAVTHGSFAFEQKIELTAGLTGTGKFTVSFYGKSTKDLPVNLWLRRYISSGVIESVPAQVTIKQSNLGLQCIYHAVLDLVDLPSGYAFTPTDSVSLIFHVLAGTEQFVLSISNVKLEHGSIATPFIPDDPATNLAKCQRYYEAGTIQTVNNVHGLTASLGRAGTNIVWKSTKRVSPTLKVTNLFSSIPSVISEPRIWLLPQHKSTTEQVWLWYGVQDGFVGNLDIVTKYSVDAEL